MNNLAIMVAILLMLAAPGMAQDWLKQRMARQPTTARLSLQCQLTMARMRLSD